MISQETVEMVRGLWEPFKGVGATAVDWHDEAIRMARLDECDTLDEALDAAGLSE